MSLLMQLYNLPRDTLQELAIRYGINKDASNTEIIMRLTKLPQGTVVITPPNISNISNTNAIISPSNTVTNNANINNTPSIPISTSTSNSIATTTSPPKESSLAPTPISDPPSDNKKPSTEKEANEIKDNVLVKKDKDIIANNNDSSLSPVKIIEQVNNTSENDNLSKEKDTSKINETLITKQKSSPKRKGNQQVQGLSSPKINSNIDNHISSSPTSKKEKEEANSHKDAKLPIVEDKKEEIKQNLVEKGNDNIIVVAPVKDDIKILSEDNNQPIKKEELSAVEEIKVTSATLTVPETNEAIEKPTETSNKITPTKEITTEAQTDIKTTANLSNKINENKSDTLNSSIQIDDDAAKLVGDIKLDNNKPSDLSFDKISSTQETKIPTTILKSEEILSPKPTPLSKPVDNKNEKNKNEKQEQTSLPTKSQPKLWEPKKEIQPSTPKTDLPLKTPTRVQPSSLTTRLTATTTPAMPKTTTSRLSVSTTTSTIKPSSRLSGSSASSKNSTSSTPSTSSKEVPSSTTKERKPLYPTSLSTKSFISPTAASAAKSMPSTPSPVPRTPLATPKPSTNGISAATKTNIETPLPSVSASAKKPLTQPKPFNLSTSRSRTNTTNTDTDKKPASIVSPPSAIKSTKKAPIKFDLQASLQRPITWDMKIGSNKKASGSPTVSSQNTSFSSATTTSVENQ